MSETTTSLLSSLPVKGGTMYFPTSTDAPAGALAPEAATAVLETILGPRPGMCLVLVNDQRSAGPIAAGLAARCASLTGNHPNAPWGVLLLKPGVDNFEEGVAQVRTSQGGNLIVVYPALEVSAMGRASFIRTVATSTRNPYVVLTNPGVWQHELVDADDLDLLDHVTGVVDATTALPDSLPSRLREHADELATFHGIQVPDTVVIAAATDGPPDAGPAGGLVPSARQPELGLRRLDRWAARAALEGAPAAVPPSTAFDFADLFTRLSCVVHGQDAAVRTVAEQVTLGQAGLRLRADRPRSVVLLTGPTGTGKSLLGTALADVLGGTGRLVRVNLSGMTGAHDIATLLGSPPGYVGSNEDGRWLTTRIAARPDAVLLLDEIDKSHASIWSAILLELLGAGTLTDAQGRVVDARGLHVILTANLGAGELVRRGAGFGQTQGSAASALRAVREVVPDEIFNRIDATVVMNPLSTDVVARILHEALTALGTRLAPLGFSIEVTLEARSALLRDGVSPRDGARLLHRTVEQLVLSPLLSLAAGRYVVDAAHGAVTIAAAPPRSDLVPDGEPELDGERALGSELLQPGKVSRLS